MKIKLFIGISILLAILCSSCYKSSDKKSQRVKGQSQTTVLQLLQQIDTIDVLGEFNASIAKEYISKAEAFSHEYPEDPMSAELLYKAALISMTVAKSSQIQDEIELYSQKALSIFDNIQKVYPEFNGIKNCIFNKGVIYDDILLDYENAEFYYRMYIATYPTDTLAINLESYLQYLGKSPEEIIAQFSSNY
jgi:tetratricopeptide (TPR) repeat protein